MFLVLPARPVMPSPRTSSAARAAPAMLSTRTCGYYFPQLYDFSPLRDRERVWAAGGDSTVRRPAAAAPLRRVRRRGRHWLTRRGAAKPCPLRVSDRGGF